MSRNVILNEATAHPADGWPKSAAWNPKVTVAIENNPLAYPPCPKCNSPLTGIQDFHAFNLPELGIKLPPFPASLRQGLISVAPCGCKFSHDWVNRLTAEIQRIESGLTRQRLPSPYGGREPAELETLLCELYVAHNLAADKPDLQAKIHTWMLTASECLMAVSPSPTTVIGIDSGKGQDRTAIATATKDAFGNIHIKTVVPATSPAVEAYKQQLKESLGQAYADQAFISQAALLAAKTPHDLASQYLAEKENRYYLASDTVQQFRAALRQTTGKTTDQDAKNCAILTIDGHVQSVDDPERLARALLLYLPKFQNDGASSKLQPLLNSRWKTLKADLETVVSKGTYKHLKPETRSYLQHLVVFVFTGELQPVQVAGPEPLQPTTRSTARRRRTIRPLED